MVPRKYYERAMVNQERPIAEREREMVLSGIKTRLIYSSFCRKEKRNGSVCLVIQLFLLLFHSLLSFLLVTLKSHQFVHLLIAPLTDLKSSFIVAHLSSS